MENQLEPAMNREVALDRLGGDVELLEELVLLMIEQSRQMLVEIRTAVASGDTKRVLIGAHTIKGSAANLEVTLLAEAAGSLEALARSNQLDGADGLCTAMEAELEHLARDAGA